MKMLRRIRPGAMVQCVARRVKATLFFLAAALLHGYALAAPPVLAAADPTNYGYVNAWFAEARGCENIHKFDRPNVIRFSIEAVLTCQALKLGGYEGEYKLVLAPNNTRARMMAAEGEVAMPTESVWSDSIDDTKFHATIPVLADGEVVFGMFVRADKLKSYSVKNLSDLKKLRPVTQRNWVRDWAVLTGLGFTPVEAFSLESIYKMIGAERADFTLWSFNSLPGFEITVDSVTLAPLPGIKVFIHGDRRFAISRAFPNAQAIFVALNKGLEILRANGTIARAWRESAYINKRTESWTALN
jgi:hypothetical protein